jgi:hypothetical protein
MSKCSQGNGRYTYVVAQTVLCGEAGRKGRGYQERQGRLRTLYSTSDLRYCSHGSPPCNHALFSYSSAI